MNLYAKIIISTLIPLTLISLIWMYQVKKLTSELENGIEAGYVTQSELATSKLDDIAYTHDYVTKVIASSKEIANALETGDNNTLFIWGMNFISNKVTNVMFFDNDGVVVSRSPDEFRFGDNIADNFIFKRLKDTGKYLGIARIDGEEVLACGRAIKKYDEYSVGYVLVATTIDTRLTNFLNHGIDGVIGYKSDTKQLLEDLDHSSKHIEILYKHNDNEMNNASFHLHLDQSPAHNRLLELKNGMTSMSVTAFIVTLLIAIFLIKIHLKPYKDMITSITFFNNKKYDIIQLKNALTSINTKNNHEISEVVNGLTEMTDMVQDKINQLSAKNEQLDRLSKTDSLTGLYNRLHLDASLIYEVSRADRYNSHLSVILIDIDYFKAVNDSHGHPVGDKVLVEFSRLVLRNTRNTDITGRWGGEEFIVICPETSLNEAMIVAEKIHAILNCTSIAGLEITASMGISEFHSTETVHSLVKRADEALYRAKEDGRNCIRT